MTCELIPLMLTDEQKGQIGGILSVGCDRQTAANFVGCTLRDIRRAMQRDAQFAHGVSHAEAACELGHMRIVQEAAKEKGGWRVSAWWLERRAPERFARRAEAITPRQLKAFVEILIDILNENVHDESDRERLSERLRAVGESVGEVLRDSLADSNELSAFSCASLSAVLDDDSTADGEAGE